MSIARIKTLLESPHPVSGAWNADDALASAQFNANDIQRVKSNLTGDEMFSATVTADFAALTDHKQLAWLSFCGRDNIAPGGAANVAFVQWVFGPGSDTVAALVELRKEMISLATQEGLGTVAPGHIENARY